MAHGLKPLLRAHDLLQAHLCIRVGNNAANHVIDIRKDTYEIFAEPVDPNEVENYYTIVKQPMDFGTMRAKLHEGMYKTLQQFEVEVYKHWSCNHDVFLIFNNAMNFNPPGTIYFKQARVIGELAKKVFDVLRTDPEKFEIEFSETRQQVGKKNQRDFTDSTHVKSNKTIIEVPSHNVSCSSHVTSSRKIAKTSFHDTSKHDHARDVEVHTGNKDIHICTSVAVDRHCTYRRFYRDEPIVSTIYDDRLKLLEHVSQQDNGYKDSLMLFVKDLGPTAQNIAKRKLLGCEIRTASAFSPASYMSMSQNPLNKMRSFKGKTNLEIDGEGKKIEGSSCSNYLDSTNCVEKFNRSNCGSKESDKKSRTTLDKNQEQLSLSTQDKCQTNILESRLESNYKLPPRPWLLVSNEYVSHSNQDKIYMQKSTAECVIGECENTEAQCSTVPLASNFVFNLPYLKTRLDQIDSSEQYKLL
ncbi:uncharacterized protein [Medicago truncatula]|uniref:uncharacterized protein n=1 Tax=Medicago truncatula TaxID=3880 RepID=UPI000D2F1970|nr:uncharacterized protein LOC11428759 [Medicago truncatula]